MKCPYCQFENMSMGKSLASGSGSYSSKYLVTCKKCGKDFVYDNYSGAVSRYDDSKEDKASEWHYAAGGKSYDSRSAHQVADTNEYRAKPQEIYKLIIDELNGFIGKIGIHIEDERVAATARETKNIAISKLTAVHNESNALKKNSEWDRFTIAFYGETKAGKSTIIETLRIVFNEKVKIEQRRKFNQEKLIRGADFEGLKKYADGNTIGDGTSDFTKKNVTYECNADREEFNLIDVPGIEGNETVVKDAILEAVQKAHVVFYVVKYPRTPNVGTLDKIKEHLRAQTEVWVIFNKPITSPRGGLKKDFLDDDTKASLDTMDGKIRETLGAGVYRGHIVFSALPAFYAVAECLLPGKDEPGSKPSIKQQQKFLGAYSSKELLEKSKFSEFCNKIHNEILVDGKTKILISNYNKMRKLLDDINMFFDEQKKKHEQLKKDIDGQIKDARRVIFRRFDAFDRNMANNLNDNLLVFKNAVRKRMFAKIDEGDGIKDDEVQDNLKAIIDDENRNYFKRVESKMQTDAAMLTKEINDRVKNFQKSIKNMSTHCSDDISLPWWSLSEQWGMTVDNGFRVTDLFKELGAAAILTGGWGFLVALPFSLVKNFKSLFSKAEERKLQKKSVETAINELLPKIKKYVEGKGIEIKASLDGKKESIIQSLGEPLSNVTSICELIDRQGKFFRNLTDYVERLKGENR